VVSIKAKNNRAFKMVGWFEFIWEKRKREFTKESVDINCGKVSEVKKTPLSFQKLANCF